MTRVYGYGYSVPPVPLVTIRATYQCDYWPNACDGCGAENPAEWGGYCDPANPWGTADDTYDPDAAGDEIGEPVLIVLPVYAAAKFLADFPGAVWELETECEASQNYRTGVHTRVTAHVDGPGAPAALELAGDILARRRADA